MCLKTRGNKHWREHREKGALVYCWWEHQLVQPLQETVWRLLKKLKIKLPYDSAIPLLGIYVKETQSLYQRDICTPCSLQHYLQQPRHGNNRRVHQQMNG